MARFKKAVARMGHVGEVSELPLRNAPRHSQFGDSSAQRLPERLGLIIILVAPTAHHHRDHPLFWAFRSSARSRIFMSSAHSSPPYHRPHATYTESLRPERYLAHDQKEGAAPSPCSRQVNLCFRESH